MNANKTTPRRVQRKRTKGWRMPANTVSVTRPGRWGNPFFPGSGFSRGFFDENMNPVEYDVRDPRVQVQWFSEWLADMMRDQPKRFEALIAPLRGKNLACWCGLDQPCHADVLLKLAGAHGFEPRSSELEADILPLNYAPGIGT